MKGEEKVKGCVFVITYGNMYNATIPVQGCCDEWGEYVWEGWSEKERR